MSGAGAVQTWPESASRLRTSGAGAAQKIGGFQALIGTPQIISYA